MGNQRTGTDPDVMGTLVHADELERRRSGAQPVANAFPIAPPSRYDEYFGGKPVPTTAELRDQYVTLVAAREHSPERLTPSGLAVFEAHEQVAREYMATDGEEIYQMTASGYLMRQRLREILPDWFVAE